MRCQQAAARYTTQERGSADLFGLKGNQESVLARAIVRLPQACFFVNSTPAGPSNPGGSSVVESSAAR